LKTELCKNWELTGNCPFKQKVSYINSALLPMAFSTFKHGCIYIKILKHVLANLIFKRASVHMEQGASTSTMKLFKWINSKNI
jgi:hypothetical protein